MINKIVIVLLFGQQLYAMNNLDQLQLRELEGINIIEKAWLRTINVGFAIGVVMPLFWAFCTVSSLHEGDMEGAFFNGALCITTAGIAHCCISSLCIERNAVRADHLQTVNELQRRLPRQNQSRSSKKLNGLLNGSRV